MKSHKLNLNNLAVSSFVTSLEKKQSETINGGFFSISFCGPAASLPAESFCGRCSLHICYDTYNPKPAVTPKPPAMPAMPADNDRSAGTCGRLCL